MNHSRSLFALLPVALGLTGCSGSAVPTNSAAPTTQVLGPLTTRIAGTAQSPVTSSAANGANVTGIAGALIDLLTLNAQGPASLAESKLVFYSNRSGNDEIYAMNVDGSNPVNLTNNPASEQTPSWSKDGSKIAFASNRDGNTEIYVMNANGTAQTRLTNNAATDFEPEWSPDGSKIAFFSNRDGNFEIYVMNADGTGVTRLTNNAAVDVSPAWSPDGSKIAFQTDRGGDNQIFTVNADGSNLTDISGGSFGGAPSWSPDGKKIAFYSYRDINYEIYVMNADGSNPVRLTNNTAIEYSPVWSPDGSKLTFYSNRDGNFNIFTMNPDGSDQTRLTVGASTDEQPSWSGYLPRTPRTLIGSGGALGATAAGFLYAQNGAPVSSVVAFDTSTVGSRAGARVASQTANETQGRNLIFSITTTSGLASVNYANVSAAGVPGAAISPTIPAGSTGALVSFVASDGTVSSVLPYAANRSVPAKKVNGTHSIYSGNFTAIFDAAGKNLAPSGAKSVTLDEKTGKLIRFE